MQVITQLKRRSKAPLHKWNNHNKENSQSAKKKKVPKLTRARSWWEDHFSNTSHLDRGITVWILVVHSVFDSTQHLDHILSYTLTPTVVLMYANMFRDLVHKLLQIIYDGIFISDTSALHASGTLNTTILKKQSGGAFLTDSCSVPFIGELLPICLCGAVPSATEIIRYGHNSDWCVFSTVSFSYQLSDVRLYFYLVLLAPFAASRDSSSLRLSLRICTNTVHSGSLIVDYFHFVCEGGIRTHVLTDPGTWFFKVRAMFPSTSKVDHVVFFVGCARATPSLKFLLQAPSIEINVLPCLRKMKCVRLYNVPCLTSAPHSLLLPSSPNGCSRHRDS